MNFSKLCTILVTFGPENPKYLLWRYGKNRHITSNISECPAPILTYFTGLVGVLVGMIIPIFSWQSPKGCCYGNQKNSGDVSRHCQKRPLLFALAFDNKLANTKSTFKRLNGNNPATSCTNLVNMCPVISEFMLLKCAIFATIRPSFVTLAFQYELEDCNFNFSRVTGNHFCTSCTFSNPRV